MSLAVQYAMRKKQMMAQGGACQAHGTQMCKMCHGGKMMAEGGFVEEEEASGYEPMPQENRELYVEHPVENQEFPSEEEDFDMVDRIMKRRATGYSEGGKVSNDTSPMADFEENQFDDLVKDDDLEQHYTGENSGDQVGNAQKEEDEKDVVARIMKSRRMRDRMPSPA